jgi:hypothetical protein
MDGGPRKNKITDKCWKKAIALNIKAAELKIAPEK